jgi:[protein-PII] uridylyltransferase
VDEHSLRAVEALGETAQMTGRVAEMLQETLDHILAPHILVLAILLHDLGKAEGDEHVEAGVGIAERICARIGLHPEDTEQIAFLVRHHMLMNNIAMYRDADDLEVVRGFAEQLRDVERLRHLLLLSFADLRAVGPTVWNEWKGALLLKLYLRAERILLGRGNVTAEDYWNLPKAREAVASAPEAARAQVEAHLRGMGERYFVSFTPQEVIDHVACLEEARALGVAVRHVERPEQGVATVVVCTPDHHGLFAQIAGSFTSQLLDVERADLFTTPDGYALDCFTVRDAVNRRAPTPTQCDNFAKTLRAVVCDGAALRGYVEQSRRKLFALLQPRVPVRTQIAFDNGASRSDTVIDVLTGDRTGLLYDIADRLSAMGVDLYSARIVTDARHARDAFYVRMLQEKIEDPTKQAQIRDGLLAAIERGCDAEQKGVQV